MISDIFFPLADSMTRFLRPSVLSFFSFTSPLAPISLTMLLTDGCECPISLAMEVMVLASPRDRTKNTGNHLGRMSTPYMRKIRAASFVILSVSIRSLLPMAIFPVRLKKSIFPSPVVLLKM